LLAGKPLSVRHEFSPSKVRTAVALVLDSAPRSILTVNRNGESGEVLSQVDLAAVSAATRVPPDVVKDIWTYWAHRRQLYVCSSL